MGSKTPEPQDFLRVIRQHLIALRLESRVTVKDAAATAGLSRGGLEKIESGANAPNLETLRKLCQSYHCSLRTFFAGVEEQIGIRMAQNRELESYDPSTAESFESLKKLALSSGRQREWSVFESLCTMSDDRPELFESFAELISLSTTKSFPAAFGPRRSPPSREDTHSLAKIRPPESAL